MFQIVQKLDQLIHSPEFSQRHKTHCSAFTRNRKLPFSKLVYFLLNQVKGALQDELDAFSQYVDGDGDFVSKAAFCKARKFLSPLAFIELRDTINQQFYQSNHVKTWKGLRLCAVDATTLTLPQNATLLSTFGGRKNKHKTVAQAMLSQVFDPLNQLTLDTELSSYNACERSLALKQLERIQGENLFLYDRGYYGFRLYSAHRYHQQAFCCRLPTNQKIRYVTEFLASGQNDAVVTVFPSDQDKGRYHSCVFSLEPIDIRLVKVILPSGEIEVLATNLMNSKRYTRKHLKQVYFIRWGVETDFRQQKHTLLLERFSGKSLTAVLQDIYAKVVMKNIARLITICAEQKLTSVNQKRQHHYKINTKQALSKCKHTFIQCLRAIDPRMLLDRLIQLVFRCLEPERKDRRYPRHRLVGTRCATHGTYKGTR